MKEFLLNPWVIAIGSPLLVSLVIHLLRKISKTKQPFKFRFAEVEISFDEKFRSLKMDVIKVLAHDHSLGVRAEYEWLDNTYPNNKKFRQSLYKIEIGIVGNKKKVVTFDVHEIQLKDGRKKNVYFEIDSFFADGKPISFNNNYEYQKIKDLYLQ